MNEGTTTQISKLKVKSDQIGANASKMMMMIYGITHRYTDQNWRNSNKFLCRKMISSWSSSSSSSS